MRMASQESSASSGSRGVSLIDPLERAGNLSERAGERTGAAAADWHADRNPNP